MTELARIAPKTAIETMRDWSRLPEDERKRRAARAANDRDFEELWSLTHAYVLMHGSKGHGVSKLTLKEYKAGVKDLLNAWQGENLLRPGRDSGTEYIRTLETEANSRTGKPLNPSTVGKKKAAAQNLFKALRWAGVTEANPFDDVRVIADKTAKEEKRKPYSEVQIERLLEQATLADKVLILLAAHAGLRISEVCSIHWQDISFDGATLRVTGKGGKRARVGLSERLLVFLESLKKEPARKSRKPGEGYVLPFGDDQARIRLKNLCIKAGVEYSDKGFHGLRHSAGTRYYKQSKDLGRVAAHLRHENIQTTRIYAKLAAEEIAQDLRNW
jgi:integrase